MITEHAVTYKDNLNLEQLEYIIKKANRLGANSKTVTRVFKDEDAEGIHIYFDVVGYADSH